MASPEIDFLMQILIFGGLAIFFGAPIAAAVFLKDKLSFWPGRKPFSVQVKSFKPGEVVDEKGHVKEEQLEETPKKNWKAWKIVENKIPYIYVEYGFLKGFKLDAVGLALLRNLPSPTLRLAQLADGQYDANNFRFIDSPEKLDYNFVKSAISGMGKSLRESIRAEFSRPTKDTTIMDMILQALPYLIAALIIILSLNWGSDQINKTTSFAQNEINAACYAAAHNPPINATSAQKQSGQIPFMQTS